MTTNNLDRKVIIFSAPSGSGKSTIVRHLLALGLPLEFSVSATSRPPRGQERDGREYHFLTPDEFQRRVDAGDFLEWEEVYPGCRYGTLHSELERVWARGHAVLFDVDVIGGLNIKRLFGPRALAIFVQAPSLDALRQRLVARGTDAPDKIETRLAKAATEMTYRDRFDLVLVNDRLADALAGAERAVRAFLNA